MAEQTAVNWLLENLQKVHKMDWDIVFMQAELMEKEQIINAWMATDNELQRMAAEQYYEEKYGRKSEILITKSENK